MLIGSHLLSIHLGPWTLLLLLLAGASAALASASSYGANIRFPLPDDCPTSCGNISVEYPFGLKDGCFRPGFNLFFNTSAQPYKLFLGEDNTTQVFYITTPAYSYFFDEPLVFIDPLSQVFNISRDDPSSTRREIISWSAPGTGNGNGTGNGTPYAISHHNVLTVTGCGVRAFLIDGRTNETVGNCTSMCLGNSSTGSCSESLGDGCCRISFPQGLRSFKIELSNFNSTQQSSATTVKILVHDRTTNAKEYYKDVPDWAIPQILGTQNINGDNLRVSLEWAIPDELTCESALKDKSSYACLSRHSYCQDSTTPGFGYNCYCQNHWFEDINAYIPHGCKAKCRNRICSKLLLGLIIGISIGMALLLFVISAKFIIRKWKKEKQKKIKEKHFYQNHGLLLRQLISSNEDVAARTKLFSLEEMEKATNNFNVTRILGKGGHGTVYKGILADQRVVAIKKSKKAVKREIDQFINEVVILSRINHRNIVRLLGCCLEIEVPLLVYEFIPNGTLYDHLHSRDANRILSWEDRLRIAIEVATALAYLHSAAFISILHRDVKSSNILLDSNLTAKVSDFGSSRSIQDYETHVVTIVQGTYGYLDPQYHRTGELTDKSDVYSFGVILLELLTGKKPILADIIGEERSLAIKFLRAINENQHFDLLDVRVQVEGAKEELEYVAQLACMCTRFESKARPTMKEVEYRLQVLITKRKQTRVIGEPLILVSSNASHGTFIDSNSNQANEDASRNYSMQRHFLSSLDFPR